MALVAYENSDSSEYEEDEEIATPIKNTDDISEIESVSENDHKSHISLFHLLPQPSNIKKEVLEEDDEFLHKKESSSDVKPKSRITIPSLKDFKDVEHIIPSLKTKISNRKKSGLLSILPEPKNDRMTTKSLIPNVIAQKPKTNTAKKKDLTLNPFKLSNVETQSSLTRDYSDESDDEVQNDFFSINKPVAYPIEELPLVSEEKSVPITTKEPRSIESYFKKDEVKTDYSEFNNSDEYYSLNVPEQINENDNKELVLDDEAILKLCGTRGKRKREEIQIVDINQQEVLGDAREWLLKNLMDDTSKRQSSSKRHGNEPTSQQKRKHQITYLAHQAKANETELQNQWATNRMNKRKTQSKYGF